MKIIIIKKIHLKLLVALIIIISSSILLYNMLDKSLETAVIPSTTRTVVIDPGHGGIDPGAVGKNSTLEKDINLEISLYLREYLEQSGAVVILTREKDVGLYDEEGSIRNKKNQDLKRRKDIVKDSNGSLFITIHLNSFTQSQYYGAQAFYPKDNIGGKELAKVIQEELINVLDQQNKRVPLPKDNIYLIKNINIPTVLVECGFLSNPQELTKLKNKEYQKKIAWALYVGIQRYFNESY